jgi:hypothetical protein
MTNRYFAVAPAFACVLAGCSTFDTDYDKYADKHSAYQLVQREEFEPIDLVSLIDESAALQKNAGLDHALPEVQRQQGPLVDQAFRNFAERYRSAETVGRARRTEIQERILAASDQRCNDFKTLLQKKISNVSFNTGLVATGAAVAATIVDNLDTSKALAGIAGLASGYRAEYNQAYFANAAVQVVVAGIDSRRRTAYEQIRHARNESMANYPLEAAVKDAIRYHGLCSTVSGLQEAGEAVRYYNEPGITAATRTVARSKMLLDIQGSSAEQVIDKLKRWQEIVPAERYLAGNPLGDSARPAMLGAQEVMDYYEGGRASVRKRGATISAALKGADKNVVPAAEADKAVKIADSIEASIVKFCQPEFSRRAGLLLSLQAERANAEGEKADQLLLKLEQAAQGAEIVKASLNFVVANYLARADQLKLAIAALKDPADKTQTDAVKQALARLNAYAPVLAEGCEVQPSA